MENFKLDKNIKILKNNTDNNIIVLNNNTKKNYILGKKEANVLQYFDGQNSIKEIAKKNSYFNEDELRQLALQLKEIGIIENKKIKKKINPLKIKLSLFNPDKHLKSKLLTNILFYITYVFNLTFIIFGGLCVYYRLSFGNDINKIEYINNIDLANLNLKKISIIIRACENFSVN